MKCCRLSIFSFLLSFLYSVGKVWIDIWQTLSACYKIYGSSKILKKTNQKSRHIFALAVIISSSSPKKCTQMWKPWAKINWKVPIRLSKTFVAQKHQIQLITERCMVFWAWTVVCRGLQRTKGQVSSFCLLLNTKGLVTGSLLSFISLKQIFYEKD